MKSFRQILIESKQGVYIGMRLSEESINKILEFIKVNKIKNGVNKDDLHTTIIYSTKPDRVKLTPLRNAEGVFSKFSKFGEDKNVLVMEIDCKELEELHEYYMSNYNLSWDWDSYKPHITLSYDASKIDETKLIWPFRDKGRIKFSKQYYEPLDPNWEESK